MLRYKISILQDEKKLWRWLMMMVAQRCEYTQCHQTVHLKRVNLVNCMCILPQLVKIIIFYVTVDGIEQIWFLKTLKTVPCMDSACPPPPFWGFRGQGVTSVAPSLPLPVCIWSWLTTQGTCSVGWTWLLTVPA